MKIGIIDWGIGGVGLLQKIRERSDADILYFSDAGFTPYGKVPEQKLRMRLQKVINYLTLKECELIAVACNAASTVLPDEKNLIGIIKPAIETVKELNTGSVGIVGGKRTIESEIYKRELEKSGIKVIQRIAQPLSARIEAGDLHSEEMKNEIREIFEPLRNEKYILLACTHYPVISEQISQIIPESALVDPVHKMCDSIIEKADVKSGYRSVKWMTSGTVYDMIHVLKSVYNINANSIERNVL